MAVSPEACKDEVAALAKGSNLLGQQTPTVEPGASHQASHCICDRHSASTWSQLHNLQAKLLLMHR